MDYSADLQYNSGDYKTWRLIMDQIAVGNFIKTLRKEKALTQRELADKLGISEKTVSKWETGNGLPEVDNFLPLCNELGVTVNELLSGKRLDPGQYVSQAENTILGLMKEKAESKKKIALEAVVCGVTLLAGITIILTAGLAAVNPWLRAVLIGVALIVIAGGITVACVLDRDAGYFECPHCHARFVPTMGAYVAACHTLTKRKLVCPVCGKKSYCKKRLSR